MRSTRNTLFASLFLALALASPAQAQSGPFAPVPVAPNAGLSGAWFDPTHVGQGIILNVLSPSRAAIIWTTFTPQGQTLWLVGEGRIEPERIRFDALTVSGGRFPGSGSGTPQNAPWGTLTLDFPSCTQARLTWTSSVAGYGSGNASLTRLTQPLALHCDDDAFVWQWSDLGAPTARTGTMLEGRSATVVGGEVILATADGLWRRRHSRHGLADQTWQRAGLEGFNAAFVIADDDANGRLFAGGTPRDATEKPLYVSDDGGRSWSNATQTPFHPGQERHEAFADVAVAPNDAALIYASLEGGPGIAVSTDGGRIFVRADGSTEPYFGYNCHIAFLPDQPDRLYQGCEALLDSIRIGYYAIEPNNPERLGEFHLIASTDPNSPNDVQNRRPQRLLHSPGRPGVLYSGNEGALFAFDAADHMEKVFFSPIEDNGNDVPYLYMDAAWIDARNPSHLIFGGGLNGENLRVGLYETHDHGLRNIEISQPPFALTNPAVDTLVPLDESGDHFLVVIKEAPIADLENNRLRVLKLERVRGAGLPTAH